MLRTLALDKYLAKIISDAQTSFGLYLCMGHVPIYPPPHPTRLLLVACISWTLVRLCSGAVTMVAYQYSQHSVPYKGSLNTNPVTAPSVAFVTK